MTPGSLLSYAIGEEEAGERVDVVLSGLARVPRSQVRRWIEAGRVEVDGEVVPRSSRKVALGEQLVASPPAPVDAIARPGDSSPSGVAMLTDREREVLQLIAEGLSSKEIASMLGVSLKTVDSHRSNLMEKLDIHKVSGLVRFAIRAGLVEP